MSGVTASRVATLVMVWLLVGLPIAGAAGTALGAPVAESVDSVSPTKTVQAENNTTAVQHEDPGNISERGDLDMVKQWLEGRMGDVLVDCTEGAKARDWGACDTNESYPEWLDKYVDVARETETTTDDEASDSFEKARENQERFNSDVQEFYDTYDSYRQARANGNTARARQLARELRRLQSDTNRSGKRLRGDYQGISNTTATNLTDTSRTVVTIQTNVTKTTKNVSQDVFIETTLRVTADDRDISYANPLELEGEIRMANGTALANRDIRIGIGNRRVTTTTDTEGRFEITYRPTTIPLDSERVTVRYLPRNESVYLPANASMPVNITQVPAEVSATAGPDVVAFGETVLIEGDVTAAGWQVSGLPVDLYLGSRQVGTVRTNQDGTFRRLLRLPAAVPTGEQSVRAVVPLEDQALAGDTAETSIRVSSTSTTLDINVTETGPRQLRVSGTLRTANNEPLPGRDIEIQVNGSTIESVSTGPGGQYQTTVAIPNEVPHNATVIVAGRFDGESTNLNQASAETTLEISAPAVNDESSNLELDDFAPTAIGGLLGLLLFVAAGYLVRRYQPGLWARLPSFRDDGSQPSTASNSYSEAGTTYPVDLQDVEADTSPQTLLEVAEQRIAAGDADAGAIACYAALRRSLADRIGQGRALTHWEFYTTVEDEAAAAGLGDPLREATSIYEQAAFAPASISQEQARSVLTQIRSSRLGDGQPGD